MTNDGIEIRPVEAADSESLVACFERCYGGTYVDDTFLTSSAIRSAIDAGGLRSVVAVAEGEGVVGHMGLTPCEAGARTAEMGNTVVDPRYREQDLVVRLTGALAQRCLELGLMGFVHFPTTAHPAMQKHASRGRGVELGVLLGYIPAETRYVGIERGEATGRTAVVAFWHELAPVPERHVWVPARYRDLLPRIYERAGLGRRLDPANGELPPEASEYSVRFEARRGVLRIDVGSLGADLAERVSAEVRRQPDVPVLLDLPLSQPAVAAAVDALAGVGFCFGALLPEYRSGGDALRLQRLDAAPDEPLLATPEGRQLFAYTLADRESSGAGTPRRPGSAEGA